MRDSRTSSGAFLSIVIPAYNYGRVLDRCLASVIEGSRASEDIETLVINDGSTDNTQRVLDCWREKYPRRIRCIEQDNRGPSAVRNAGVSATSGKYLLFLDADDALVPGALEILRAELSRLSSGLVVWGHISCRRNGKVVFRPRGRFAKTTDLRFRQYVSGQFSLRPSYVAFRRDVVEAIKFPEDLRHGEDQVVFALALARFSCTSIRTPLTRVYAHGRSLGRSIEAAEAAGFRNVDAIFSSPLLPARLRSARRLYEARRALSLFRHYARVRRRRQAFRFLALALRKDWGQVWTRRNVCKILSLFYSTSEINDGG